MEITTKNIFSILKESKAFIEAGYITTSKAILLAKDCRDVLEKESCPNYDLLKDEIKEFLYWLISVENLSENNVEETKIVEVMVVENETIEKLAQDFQTTPELIIGANPNINMNQALRTGSIIKVPQNN